MGRITLQGVTKRFGKAAVIADLDLTVADGEFCVLVGPSGCGKSTVLRMIAGLEEVSAGRIAIDGRDVTDLPPYDRGLSMVFQSYALYPHLSVRDNIAFALRTARMPEAQVKARVAEAARMLQIEPYLDRRPAALSGGQRQRVAIGRAIVREPAAFLFDEPLSNLDAALRAETRLEISRLHRTLGATMIYVTHDQVEAMTLADRIVVLNGGRVEQAGPPETLYDDPDTVFVAGFLGAPRMNLLPVRILGRRDGMAEVTVPGLTGDRIAVPLRHPAAPLPESATLGFRPEALAEGGAGPVLRLTVDAVENTGATRHIFTGGPRATAVVAELPRGMRARPGEGVSLTLPQAATLLFGPDGRRL